MKKGFIGGKIVDLIIALLILLALGSFFFDIEDIRGFFGETAAKVKLDCDADGVGYPLDKCPCLDEGKISNSDRSLLGCPSAIKNSKEAAKDKDTCYKYEHDGKFFDKCQADDKTDCLTRCEAMHFKSEKETEQKLAALDTESDLVISDLKIDGKTIEEHNGKYKIDFSGAPDKPINLEGSISNLGTEAVTRTFFLKINICELKTNGRCKTKIVYNNDFSGNKLAFSETLAPGHKQSFDFHTLVGYKGDYCDSKKESECILELIIDPDNEIGEIGETNNKQKLTLSVENQLVSNSFKRFQIEIINAGPKDGPLIQRYCPIELGVPDYADCLLKLSQEYQGVDGEFPKNIRSDGNCWVLSTDFDVIDEDVGAGAFKQGYVIKHISSQHLNPFEIYHETDEDSKNNFIDQSRVWQADSKGDLICNKNFWNLCDQVNQDQILFIGSTPYTCDGKEWKQ